MARPSGTTRNANSENNSRMNSSQLFVFCSQDTGEAVRMKSRSGIVCALQYRCVIQKGQAPPGVSRPPLLNSRFGLWSSAQQQTFQQCFNHMRHSSSKRCARPQHSRHFCGFRPRHANSNSPTAIDLPLLIYAVKFVTASHWCALT